LRYFSVEKFLIEGDMCQLAAAAIGVIFVIMGLALGSLLGAMLSIALLKLNIVI